LFMHIPTGIQKLNDIVPRFRLGQIPSCFDHFHQGLT
jgi:hypothetical protein